MPQQPKSINFRVHSLASSLLKGAMQYYGAQFGVGLPEMRVLSSLGSEGPLAAHQIIALTAMDKALVSRVLTMLNRRGLATSSSPGSDPRRRTWALTCAGGDLLRRLRPEWKRREAIIQAGLSDAEQRLLADMLERMLAASERLRAAEAGQLRSPRDKLNPRAEPAPPSSVSRDGPTPGPSSPADRRRAPSRRHHEASPSR
jgi:DNA-binding MarR family transcriptional regulator